MTKFSRLFALAFALLLGNATMARAAIEEPAFKSVLKEGAFEVRDYAPTIVAQVEVRGDFGAAGNRAFNPLADYIFGNNTQAGKIAMTAPVSQTKAGAKIAMTAPVSQAKTGDVWTVRFTMPSKYTMATLPRPVNPDVRLIEVPGQRMAVVQFTGFTGDNTLKEKETALRAFAAQKGLKLTGAPIYARYDPPWTVPFMRRNEVMIAISR
jgi:hypothetical protein